MSMRASFVTVAGVVGTVLVVGCSQTPSSPTSPSSLASASSVGAGRLPAYANDARAHAASSVVHDATGDASSPAPYLDIVHAKVTEQGKGTLFFMITLAGPMPKAPSDPFLLWVFHVDANPVTAPGGLYNEYIVRVRWSSGAFVGEVIDRTPLLTGGALITTPVSFSIAGTTVKLFVQLGLLGNPSSFGWNAATRPLPPAAYLDFAPDNVLATWTQ